MGQEERCRLSYGGRVVEGKALLETDELLFRGVLRLRIPFADISVLSAEDGHLRVTFAGGEATFGLGRRAARWKERIENPPSLLDKLGVKPGQTVGLLGAVGAADAAGTDGTGFAADVAARAGRVEVGQATPGADLMFLFVEQAADLAQMAALRQSISPSGAVWVVAPKGSLQIREADLLAAGPPAGLVDVKVARFSATHTAHKFVIPLAQR